MKFILKCEVALIMISLILVSTFVHLRVPYLAMTPPELPGSELWWQYGLLEIGSYSSSLQVLAVIFTVLVLRPLWASIAIGSYLALGFMGLPIFFHGGGSAYFQQGTLGYLLSFLGAAGLARFFLKPNKDHQPIPRSSYLLAGFVCLLAIHGVGGIYASVFFQMVPIEFLLRYAVPQLVWQTLAIFALSWAAYQIQVFFYVPPKAQSQTSRKRRKKWSTPNKQWRKSA